MSESQASLVALFNRENFFDIDPSIHPSNFPNSINNREKDWENVKFPFRQVGITRKTVQRSQGYRCTWWSVERSEPCSWCCSSTRRYSRGGRKCHRSRPTGPKFPSWSWSSSSYHASCSAGSWWVRDFSFVGNTPHRIYLYLDIKFRCHLIPKGENLIATNKVLLPLGLLRDNLLLFRQT